MQYQDYKQETEQVMKQLERSLETAIKERDVLQNKYKLVQSRQIDIENENDVLSQRNRGLEAIVSDYESKINQTLEQLALVQTELDENKTTKQEEFERLREQLKETKEELMAV